MLLKKIKAKQGRTKIDIKGSSLMTLPTYFSGFYMEGVSTDTDKERL